MVTVQVREVACHREVSCRKTSRVKQAASSVQIAEDVQWDCASPSCATGVGTPDVTNYFAVRKLKDHHVTCKAWKLNAT